MGSGRKPTVKKNKQIKKIKQLNFQQLCSWLQKKKKKAEGDTVDSALFFCGQKTASGSNTNKPKLSQKKKKEKDFRVWKPETVGWMCAIPFPRKINRLNLSARPPYPPMRLEKKKKARARRWVLWQAELRAKSQLEVESLAIGTIINNSKAQI